MSVVFFASGGPGNFAATLQSQDENPGLLSIDLLITDRPAIPAIELAEQRGIPVLTADFAALYPGTSLPQAEPWQCARRRRVSAEFHDGILRSLLSIEHARGGRFDLAVLAYRRVILGDLLQYFSGRMINQHPADLSVFDALSGQRRYVGIQGHARELGDGRGSSCTSTIIVREGVDTGEIIAQGPRVRFSGNAQDGLDVERHETAQKELSDWIALRCSLLAIAKGLFAVSTCEAHDDGCRVVYLGADPLPYAGLACSQSCYAELLAADVVYATSSVADPVAHL